jgi:hypothetical protein
MASSKPILTDAFPVSADLSADQYLFVTLNSSGELELPPNSTTPVIGVLDDTPRAGSHGTVVILGTAKVAYGASLTVMEELSAATSGKAIAAASGDCVIALALEAGASGEIHKVLLVPSGLLHA